MRLLADENLPKSIAEGLRMEGHDVLWDEQICRGSRIRHYHPATVENLAPLVRLFIDSDKTWSGHVSVVTASGMEMFALGKPRIT